MPQPIDVLIIGGGPAGLAAGIAFAEQGVKTLVCERRQLPAGKACGEGIMPRGVEKLERLGVAGHIPPDQIGWFEGVRYISASGRQATGRFSKGMGWGVPRRILSEAFLKRAAELENLEVRDGLGQSLRLLPRNGRPPPYSVQVGQDLFSPRLLVGADGLHSTVRRWAGLATRTVQKKGAQRWGLNRHFMVTPWSSYVEVYWSDGLEAYVTPCGPGQTNLAFLWRGKRVHVQAGESDLYTSLLGRFPELERRLNKVPAGDEPHGAGPLRQQPLSPVAEGLALVGDAAGYLDALTGEGISLAVSQALALAACTSSELLNPSAAGRPVGRQVLARYARSLKQICRPYRWSTEFVLQIGKRAWTTETSIAVLSRSPRLFQALIEAAVGRPSAHVQTGR